MFTQKPNTTLVPNFIFDEWIPGRTKGEMKIIIYLSLKIFSTSHFEAEIQMDDLVHKTGLTKKTVNRSLKSLVNLGFIKKIILKDKYKKIFLIKTAFQQGVIQ